MAVKWTEEQKKVIDSRGKSLLVSAAAGSGKTAVLVARILSRIMDETDPVDVDRLLVVTFTNAAAAGMRERIGLAVEEAQRSDPDNVHLERQSALIENAQITTIHSFCLQLIRSHFHAIGLAPDFRVADTGELRLMKEEVFAKVLDACYAKKQDAFLRFSDNYSTGRSDEAIKEMVFALYEQAQSNPWPAEWISQTKSAYTVTDEASLSEKSWYQKLQHDVCLFAQACADETADLISLALDADGPASYEEALRDDLAFYRGLASDRTYAGWYEVLSQHTFTKLKQDRKFTGSIEKKESVKNRRDALKKQVAQWKADYFNLPVSEQIASIQKTGEMYAVLCDLTDSFAKAFAAQKEKKHLVDFSDIEHFALAILLDPVTHEPTDIAREYQKKFREVMIDEYQDSNYVQEALLAAVSGDFTGIRNRFMVGDIKQSIYRFRLARPELFLEKYESYAGTESESSGRERIDLHQNFRSRQEVIDLTNRIFSRIMQADIGNVSYDDAAALRHGRDDSEDQPGNYVAELLLLDSTESAREQAQKEAYLIAERIRRLVRDEEIPGITYGDIVILTRAPSGISELYQDIFHEADIPLMLDTKTGYFSAREVKQVLALLQVIDNPMQDIPLAAAMRSPFGGFSSEELAKIRIAFPGIPFHTAVSRLSDAGIVSSDASNRSDRDTEALMPLAKKTVRFIDLLTRFRQKMRDMPIYRLLEEIYHTTGFLEEVQALPAGRQRKANLDMLMEKAIAFSKTSYQGLLHFNRYIERLQRYQIDFGEAELPDDGTSAVRLMSIHKSKGLEFPVVFVAGTGKGFNERDLQKNLVIHADYGCGLRDIDRSLRIKKDTILRRALAADLKKENLGEELRVLYVAMTRAEKKLILTGSYDLSKASALLSETPQQLAFAEKLQAKCYLDWILRAMSDQENDLIRMFEEAPSESGKQQRAMEIRTDQNTLYREAYDADSVLTEQIQTAFSWKYPYPDTVGLRQKVSVSEIKHRAYEENRTSLEFDPDASLYQETIAHPYVPRFLQEEAASDGAAYGTAMHFFLQNLDFAALPAAGPGQDDYIRRKLKELQESSSQEVQTFRMLSEKRILQFTASSLADRVRQQAAEGKLFLEQPFVMSIPAQRVWPEHQSAETEDVLTQGIIDVFWIESDGIVLLDYKTDRIRVPQELLDRYEVQMRLYEEALNRRFPALKVKEIWIYSFWLGEAIPVKNRGV